MLPCSAASSMLGPAQVSVDPNVPVSFLRASKGIPGRFRESYTIGLWFIIV
jgi:hypothetical protein